MTNRTLKQNGWNERSIGSMGRVITGRTPKTSNKHHFAGDTPFVTPSDMDGSKYVLRTGRTLSEEGVASVSSAVIPPNAVLVSCIGSDMGKAAISPSVVVTNQQINSLIVEDDEVDFEFVYYNLAMRKRELQVLASGGSAQPIVNKTTFSNLIVPLPSRQEQRAIASILSALDDKIAVNRQIAATLEDIARAIFTSWFLRFDPVRAKAEGRVPEGMDAATAALFPDRFVPSELGEIPSGWQVVPMSAMAELVRKTEDPRKHVDKKYLHYSLPAFDKGMAPVVELGNDIKSNKILVPRDAVLLSKLNPRIPRVWLPSIGDGEGEAVCSTEFMACTSSTTPRSYLYSLFSSFEFLSHLSLMATGTSGSHQRVQPNAFLAMEVISPPPSITQAFDKVAGVMLEHAAARRHESRALAAIRDTLLPKFMSGEVRVSA